MAEKNYYVSLLSRYVNFNVSCKMQEEAKNRGKDYEIFAKSVADIDHQFETKSQMY